MTETINTEGIVKSLKVLTNGFKNEFATSVSMDDRIAELLMELSIEFVNDCIPVVDEDNRIELAMMLMETLNITA